MSKRSEHTFEFPAAEIAAAAKAEAEYHEDRLSYWQKEQDQAIARVKETAKIEVKEVQVTGGKRADVGINYGDQLAYLRMGEAGHKIAVHRESAERYRTDERVYGTQDGRVYELDTDDVHHFRLGGEERED